MTKPIYDIEPMEFLQLVRDDESGTNFEIIEQKIPEILAAIKWLGERIEHIYGAGAYQERLKDALKSKPVITEEDLLREIYGKDSAITRGEFIALQCLYDKYFGDPK